VTLTFDYHYYYLLVRMSVPTIAELEPTMYAAWRRYAQEQCFLYERFPSVHHCWTAKQEVHVMRNRLSGRTLFGCLRCLRAHMCLPEFNHVSCPRIIDAELDEGALVCPFSGNRVDDGQPPAVLNGSFEQRDDMLARMEDHRLLKRAENMKKRNARGSSAVEDAMELINDHRGNSLAYAWHLRRGASDAKDARTSRTMYKQADEAEAHARRKPLVRAAMRAAAGASGSRARSRKRLLEDEEVAASLGLVVADEAHEKLPAQDGGGGDDDDPLAMPNTVPCVVLPVHDLVADDAYLRTVLAPLAARIAQESAIPRLFAATTGPAARGRPRVRPAAAPSHEYRVPRALVAPGPRDVAAGGDRDWTGLAPTQDSKTLLQHQRHLVLYIERFLSHYRRLLLPMAGSPPHPAPVLQYAVFCDRLLWAYHRYVGEPAQQVMSYWQGDRINGEKHRLWPDGERARRIFYTLLTRVLTGDMTARDKVTDAAVFVWLRDPFLTACWRAGLFDALPPLEANLLGRGEAAHTTPGLDHLRDDLLNAVRLLTTTAAFSPHALHDFLHPAAGCAVLYGDPAPV
jgi:hypothetical protein